MFLNAIFWFGVQLKIDFPLSSFQFILLLSKQKVHISILTKYKCIEIMKSQPLTASNMQPYS